MLTHQKHNIEPVFDENSKVLILGSFPSTKSFLENSGRDIL